MIKEKNNSYYIGQIIKNMEFIIEHSKGLSIIQLQQNQVLMDSIAFK